MHNRSQTATHFIIATSFVLLAPMAAFTETVIYLAPHGGEPVLVDSENPGEYGKLPGPPHAVATGTDIARAGNLTFNLTFADVTNTTGFGFDDPTHGATRRATALAVANYLNDVLNESTGATIDIDFQLSVNVGGAALAEGGTFYPTGPDQYHAGRCHEHITTGTDPSLPFPDIRCTVDFGHTWNNGLGAPAGGEYDLASTLLHEFTHALGFAALADASGDSTSSSTNPGVYTTFEDDLLRGTGLIDLWNGSFSFIGAASDLISDDVYYAGANATAANGAANPKVYAPGTYVDYISLEHWDPTAFPNAVMSPNQAAGTMKRQFSVFEVGALQDIGFANAVNLGYPVPVEISGFSTD
ncbi:MAG: hypothetical protein KJ060_12875 [Candidatus Hydrogenedentes bacterium]|nr:hypothetical protein [Candidatus Hydrogenedentota bacterium]